MLLSNSPRPSEGLQRQLRSLGVTDQSFDATVSSGDLTRHELAKHQGARIFHLGPERDLPIFDGLDVTRVDAKDAELIVCTACSTTKPRRLRTMKVCCTSLPGGKLTMLCANPDHLVERGHKLVYCAGALAQLYAEDGGEVIYAGKPYAPIYELAAEIIAERAGRKLSRSEILAIGDGIHTDMAGAADFGLDAVFVASGLHVGLGARGSTMFASPSCSRAASPARGDAGAWPGRPAGEILLIAVQQTLGYVRLCEIRSRGE